MANWLADLIGEELPESAGGRVAADAPPSTRGAMLSIASDGELLRCPWHFWPFEIATGRCLVDPEVRVKTYPVKIDGHDVVVEHED